MKAKLLLTLIACILSANFCNAQKSIAYISQSLIPDDSLHRNSPLLFNDGCVLFSFTTAKQKKDLLFEGAVRPSNATIVRKAKGKASNQIISKSFNDVIELGKIDFTKIYDLVEITSKEFSIINTSESENTKATTGNEIAVLIVNNNKKTIIHFDKTDGGLLYVSRFLEKLQEPELKIKNKLLIIDLLRSKVKAFTN